MWVIERKANGAKFGVWFYLGRVPGADEEDAVKEYFKILGQHQPTAYDYRARRAKDQSPVKQPA